MSRRYITTPLVLATFAAVIIGFWISNSGFGAESVAWDTAPGAILRPAPGDTNTS